MIKFTPEVVEARVMRITMKQYGAEECVPLLSLHDSCRVIETLLLFRGVI